MPKDKKSQPTRPPLAAPPVITREQAEGDLAESFADICISFAENRLNDMRNCLHARETGYAAKVKRYEKLFPGIKSAFERGLLRAIPTEYLTTYYRLTAQE